MSQTLALVQKLIAAGKVRISDHAYDELMEDGLLGSDIIAGVDRALIVEDYPYYGKGPCVLVLQRDSDGEPICALWGIPAGATEPTVLITAYRPEPRKWDTGFLRRL